MAKPSAAEITVADIH